MNVPAKRNKSTSHLDKSSQKLQIYTEWLRYGDFFEKEVMILFMEVMNKE